VVGRTEVAATLRQSHGEIFIEADGAEHAAAQHEGDA
jgi:hypothetical protein